MNPVHSPAPLSTAPPAGTGRRYASSASSRQVTPVRATSGSSRWIVRVAEADPGDVEHRVGRAGRQRADPDPQVTRARHAHILPEPRGERVGC